MADIEKKIDKIEKNCYEIARREQVELKNENDTVCEQKVLEKINIYKEELAKKYSNELNKIERDYNRNIFDYEMEARIKLNNVKNNFINDVKLQIENEFINFVESEEYKEYLFRIINSTLNRFNKDVNLIIYITEKDYFKFKDEIANSFNINIEKIDNENIGGCKALDSQNRISIDNTLKNNIQEKISKINI